MFAKIPLGGGGTKPLSAHRLRALANEIKHDNSHVGIVVLDQDTINHIRPAYIYNRSIGFN